MVGSDGVEIGGGEVATFGELGFVPASALDPFTGSKRGGFFADEVDDVLDAGDFAERDVVEDGSFVEVAMSVDEAGSDGEAV